MAISIPGEFPLKLPADFKAKWVEALRSGDYEQGDYALRSASGFCCLGVACDMVGVEWKADRDGCYTTEAGNDFFPTADELGDQAISVLLQNTSLRNYLEEPVTVMREIANHNDIGVPFSEIADWIEENL